MKSRYKTDRRSADAAANSQSSSYRNFRRVLVEYDKNYIVTGLRQLHRRAHGAIGSADSAVDVPVGLCAIRIGSSS